VSKIAKKTVRRSAFFGNSALKIQCHIIKYTLKQTAFLAILPTGNNQILLFMLFTSTQPFV